MQLLKRADWCVQVEQDLVCSAGTTANLQSAYEQVWCSAPMPVTMPVYMRPQAHRSVPHVPA